MTLKNHSSGNIPVLRFAGFKAEWNVVKLGELGEFIGGGTPSTKNENFWGGNIPWISSSDLIDGNLRYINVTRYITKEAIKNSATKLIPPKSILIVSRVGVGKVAVNEQEICTSQDFQSLILKDQNYLFLSYLIQIKTKELLGFNQGTSIKGFVKSDLGTLEISIPSLPEQQKIAAFLTALDDRIQQLTHKKQLLVNYKKGCMQQIFSQAIRFKDDKGKLYPSWEEKKLMEVCSIKKGTQLNKDTLQEMGEFPVINGGVAPSGYTTEWNTIKNTVTISEGGNSCGFVNFIHQNFWSGGHCYTLNDISKNISVDLLYQKLKFEESEIQKLRVGSGLPNIQKTAIESFGFSIPKSDKEQQEIANFLSTIDDKVNLVNTQLQQTKKFKKGLLQQMFI